MYSFKIGGIRFHISVLFPAVFLFLWYSKSSHTLIDWLVGMTVHECGHLLALSCFGSLPEDVYISAFGVRFRIAAYERGSHWQDCIVAFAGPLVNFTLAVAFAFLGDSSLAAAHASLGIINVLPIYPLDGERILRAVLMGVLKPTAVECVMEIMFWCVWIVLSFLGITILCPPYSNGSLLFFASYVGISALLHKGN